MASEILDEWLRRVGNAIARKQSPILFQFEPPVDPYSVLFNLHESGQLAPVAILRFSMNGDGLVVATTSVSSLRCPPARPVGEVDAAWVSDIAYSVWEAALAA
jgi:hypothetical protein